MADCLGGFVFVCSVAEAFSDGLGGIRSEGVGRQLQVGLSAQCTGNQGFGGVEGAAAAAAYAPALGFPVGAGVIGIGQQLLPTAVVVLC